MKKKKQELKTREKSSESSFEKILDRFQNKTVIEEGKKLFITGIDDRNPYEDVMRELGSLLKDIYGVVNFRVKHRKGSKTYAFVDFNNYNDAKEALLK